MLNENLEMHSVKGNTFFELITESRVTKVRKKRWYVAHVLCITLIYNDFIFHRKNEGSRRESRKGRGRGPGIVYTHVHGKIKETLLIRDLQPALNKNIMLAVTEKLLF